jgi:hypothetical protein
MRLSPYPPQREGIAAPFSLPIGCRDAESEGRCIRCGSSIACRSLKYSGSALRSDRRDALEPTTYQRGGDGETGGNAKFAGAACWQISLPFKRWSRSRERRCGYVKRLPSDVGLRYPVRHRSLRRAGVCGDGRRARSTIRFCSREALSVARKKEPETSTQ